MSICGVCTAKNRNELFNEIKAAARFRLEYLEIRFDFLLEPVNPREIRNRTTIRLIGTNRPIWEGGQFRGKEQERIRILKEASEAGFDYVDLELETPNIRAICRDLAGKKIVSKHDFNKTPSVAKLEQIRLMASKLNPDIVKIVTTARCPEDNLTLAKFLVAASHPSNLVAFCMGNYGTPTRILAPLLGSRFVYASLYDKASLAPGQLSVEKLRGIYRLMGII